MKIQLLVPAAGLGRRLGAAMPKALVELRGMSLLARTLERLAPLECSATPVVVVPEGWEDAFREALDARGLTARLVTGGTERSESVRAGLDALDTDTDIVAVHDAARPFATVHAVSEAIDAAVACGAATLATAVVDTILVGDEQAFLVETPDRSRLWACQTPQVFRLNLLRKAHEFGVRHDVQCTDDATLVKRSGCSVRLIDGGPLNFKITTRRDLAFAEFLLDRGLI